MSEREARAASATVRKLLEVAREAKAAARAAWEAALEAARAAARAVRPGRLAVQPRPPAAKVLRVSRAE